MSGISLNEDDSHYFSTRAGQDLDAGTVASWVDQYADAQVRELMLCPNCMRTSYASDVWNPIWSGYDPNGPDDQPLLRSLPSEDRASARKWIHTAWRLHHDGIDPYALWIDRSRERGISPWLSVRMNDIHNVDDERNYIHGDFWRKHPEFRRVGYRFASWPDRAFDYAHAKVRDYHLKLIGELTERYDFDGLELDWMRFGYHFRPGFEAEGAAILAEFMAEVRLRLDRRAKDRGHPIQLGARVPSRPQTALDLGYDVATWADRGLIDSVVVTPFWATIETDMPIELWKRLLRGTPVKLAAGLEVRLQAHPGDEGRMNSLETVRGAAASLLDRGADRIYLFNYMDSETAMDDLSNYPLLLRECGSLETLAGKSRRHVVTYADTWSPGEPRAIPLPKETNPGGWVEIRIHVGPEPGAAKSEVRLGIEGTSRKEIGGWDVRLNGAPIRFNGLASPVEPWPESPVYGFDAPASAMKRGYNLIELEPRQRTRITWAEIAIAAI